MTLCLFSLVRYLKLIVCVLKHTCTGATNLKIQEMTYNFHLNDYYVLCCHET